MSLWALAYELDEPLVDDATYDAEAKLVDLTIDTLRPDLDAWFRENFNPVTGMWVFLHPEFDLLKAKLERVKTY